MTILHGAFGLLALTAIAWLLSENRRALSWRVPLAGLGLQLAIALIMLRLPQARSVFASLNDAVVALQAATQAGTSFVFGYLGGGPLPFEETTIGGSLVLAFRSLPLIIVVSALTSLLSYWRILPLIVRSFSLLFEKTLGIGGAVSLAAAANIFVGMVEAPLLIRGYLRELGRGELFMVMCTGMATIAGTVLLLYTTILGPVLDGAVGHLITASIISAPAAIMVAWIMVPPGRASTAARLPDPRSEAASSMDAVTQGTERGLSLYLNIVAMLIVLLALVHLANAMLTLLPEFGGQALSLERMLGWLMAPVVWLMGVPWSEATVAGSLMGIKTVLNELLAYLSLAELTDGQLSERSVLIMSYALCGMANFGSVGIMIGGFTGLMPERRREVASLGLKSIVGGTIATCCTGAVVGIVG
ncbi:NupC/NupG family nucleoside CNT transporter [Candidatus Rariloculus sp.]|uniref:NupC/NupG family nucleoside CNT transporter n=1 Tax=Candidatus Rariloculus sp. TaxID=3101265 RepID=UPI003D0F24A4